MERSGDSFVLIARWRDFLQAKGLAPDTIRAYTAAVTKLAVEVVRGPITGTTEDDITALLASLSSRASTKTQVAKGLRSFFGWAFRRGEMAENPAAAVGVGRRRRTVKVVLEEEELLRFFLAAAWRDPRRAWALMLTFALGCRRAELAGIAPRDVDLELGRVRLRHCKGGHERYVELSELARVAIEELRPWWTPESILGGVIPQTVTDWAHQAALDSELYAKVRQRPAHVLRASFVTHLLREHVPIHVVRDLAGHVDISTTGEYAVSIGPERAEAVARLPFVRPAGVAV